MGVTETDWTRAAEPQPDEYDTDVTLAFAVEAGYRRPAVIRGPTFLDGAISLERDVDVLFPDDCMPAEPAHGNVRRAEALLRLWPEAYRQCRRLLDNITLFKSRFGDADYVVGSVCGPGTRGFGTIAVTVDHHVGFAEGIVHEMAHHKLRALGVDFETSHRLILNDPSRKYPSPIRYDCLRPMSAVLHAQYSYTYILQLDLKILEAALDRERDRSIVAYSLAVIAPKLEFGLSVIRRHAEPDAAGARFLAGLYSWTDRILEKCELRLNEYQVERERFTHPIAG